MALETFLEVVDVSVKRMVMPVALMVSAYGFSIVGFGDGGQLKLLAYLIVLALNLLAFGYVVVIIAAGNRKLIELTKKRRLDAFMVIIHSFSFFMAYLSVAGVAMSRLE